MTYSLYYTNQFKKSLRLCQKRGLNINLIQAAISILQQTGKLPLKYKPHQLSGNYSNCWECHIQPDCLMIWMQNDRELTLMLVDTGTHSDLF